MHSSWGNRDPNLIANRTWAGLSVEAAIKRYSWTLDFKIHFLQSYFQNLWHTVEQNRKWSAGFISDWSCMVRLQISTQELESFSLTLYSDFQASDFLSCSVKKQTFQG